MDGQVEEMGFVEFQSTKPKDYVGCLWVVDFSPVEEITS